MTCSICGDRGILLKNDVAYPCGCVKQHYINNLLKISCIPPNFLNCTLDNFVFKYYARDSFDTETSLSCFELARHAHRAARDFIDRFLKDDKTDGLLFSGKVGSGKTFLACCIANALLKREKVLLFTVVPELLDQIKATYDYGRGAGEVTESDLLERARQVPLLILDDLGAHNYTEWSRNKIYSIINYRLNHHLPVIVTTNIKLDDIKEYLGERTTSRLLEMCSPYRLMVDIDIRAVRRKEKDSR